jgi:hypothetical protein
VLRPCLPLSPPPGTPRAGRRRAAPLRQFKIQIAAAMQLDEPQSSIRYFLAASIILSILIYLYFSAGPVQDD